MRRVKHLLINSALYSLYSTLVMPYLNYCCEIWGNTYKSRIQYLHIQKRAIRIWQKVDYRSQSRPLFYQLKTLNIHDMVNLKNIVFIIISCPQRRSSIAQLDPPFLRCRLCLVSPRNVYSSS